MCLWHNGAAIYDALGRFAWATPYKPAAMQRRYFTRILPTFTVPLAKRFFTMTTPLCGWAMR